MILKTFKKDSNEANSEDEANLMHTNICLTIKYLKTSCQRQPTTFAAPHHRHSKHDIENNF